uniref:hypothetical protein n=1 Tax=Lacticaseibacillus songhuajiangensis TaxID=1296539 RepID=UPI0013DE5685|nr:hypothetical protein [Lacticaseibacillus songhuajiangensis]
MQWTDEQIGDIRKLASEGFTRRETADKWTDDIGVVAHKTFELVEYSDHDTCAIYYV